MKQMLHTPLINATYETHRRDCRPPTGSCAVTTSPAKRPPRQRMTLSLQNERFRALLWQIAVVGIVVAAVFWLGFNAEHNLSVRRIQVGFAFLGREASMPITDTW